MEDVPPDFSWVSAELSSLPEKEIRRIVDQYIRTYAGTEKGLLPYMIDPALRSEREKLNPCAFLTLRKSNGELGGAILYRTKLIGHKITLVISENNEIAKAYVLPKLFELLRTDGYYIEASDKLEAVLFKEGFKHITDLRVLRIVAQVEPYEIFRPGDPRITKKNKNGTYVWGTGKNKENPPPLYSYVKEYQGLGWIRKTLFGKPCLLPKKMSGSSLCTKTCGLYS